MARISDIAFLKVLALPALFALLTMAGCSSALPAQSAASPCAINGASYDCQVERYFNVSVP